jgi:DNA-binding NtrC family response regulator
MMPSRLRILITDDDDAMRDACLEALDASGVLSEQAASGEAARTLMSSRPFDVLVVDLRMPGMDGMELVAWTRATRPETAVIVITGYATVDNAVQAMKLGAVDFLTKPFTPQTLRDTVARAAKTCGRPAALHARAKPSRAETDVETVDALIGKSLVMRSIKDLLVRVGPTDSTVLITGQSGTGKEVVARTIRDLSPRREKPFVIVDCGALVGTLFESELFGHVRGSFTGATTTKHGRLELADGGTIFFDEIGNIPPEIQAKLLRLIEEREFTRVGSNQVVRPDIRILAATSMNLLEEIDAGRFRRDLYYRLCVVPIALPPLGARRGDIPLLVDHFLAEFCQKPRTLVFSDEAMDLLMNHDWPGNVRELRNMVERAVILARGDLVMPGDLLWLAAAADQKRIVSSRLSDVEHTHIENVITEHGGNLSAAARALGIDRKTLRRKLKGG